MDCVSFVTCHVLLYKTTGGSGDFSKKANKFGESETNKAREKQQRIMNELSVLEKVHNVFINRIQY